MEPRLWEKDTRDGMERIRSQLLLSRRPVPPDIDPSWSNQVIEVISSEPLKAVEQGLAATTIDQRYVLLVVSYTLFLRLLACSLGPVAYGLASLERLY